MMYSKYKGILIQKSIFSKMKKNLPPIKYKNNFLKTVYHRLAYFGRIIRNRLENKMEPTTVGFFINSRCNFRCKYCFGDYYARHDREFTTDEIIKIIDDLYVMGTRLMVVHGGETLLQSDIGYIIDYIKSKGIYIGISTNGTFLKQRLNEIRNVDNLNISLDGAEKGNDENRGQGTFKTTLEAIKLAKKEGFCLRAQATLTRHTMYDIEYLAKLAKEIGFFLEFSILYKPLNYDASDLAMTDEEIKIAIKKIIECKKNGYPIFTSYAVLNNALNWPLSHNECSKIYEKDIEEYPRLIKCYYGKSKIVIDSDGFVYPCAPLNGEFKALNAREVGVKAAYEHILENNTCRACYHLTNNDYSLLLGLNGGQILNQIITQTRELFELY